MAARHAIAIVFFPQASKLAPAPPQGELLIGQYNACLLDHDPYLTLLFYLRSNYFIYKQTTLEITSLGGDDTSFLKVNIETYVKIIECLILVGDT